MCSFQENVYLNQCNLSCQIRMKARKVMFEAGAVSCYISFTLKPKLRTIMCGLKLAIHKTTESYLSSWHPYNIYLVKD